MVLRRLGRRGELGDGLGALRHGVLRELSREHEASQGLDLARREGRLLRVARELSRLARDALEDVVDERVMIEMPFFEMPVSGCTCLSTL